MSKQIIYRIEEGRAKKGLVYEGPYFNNYGGSIQWKERSHNTRKHPTCDQDKTLVKSFNKLQKETNNQYKNTDFYCCFTSIDQVRSWFTDKERWNLEMQGFVLAVYEADVVISSKKQGMFIPIKGLKRKIIPIPYDY